MKKRLLSTVAAIALAIFCAVFAFSCKDPAGGTTDPIPEHVHNYGTTTVAPTCISQGYTLHTCDKCGDSYKDNFVTSLEHNYSNYVCVNCKNISSDMPDTTAQMRFYESGDGYYFSGVFNSQTQTVIKVPATYEGKPVIGISNNFRDNAYIRSIYLPDTITSLDDGTFRNCTALSSVHLGSGITSINTTVLVGCENLLNIDVSPNNPKYSSSGNCLINKDTKTLLLGTGYTVVPEDGSVETIDAGAFFGNKKVTEINTGNKVKSVGYQAFAYCPNLKKVTFGSSVNGINDMALDSCPKIEELVVVSGNTTYKSAGNCVINIANKTLSLGCKNSVIPEDGSVTALGSRAFYRCSELKTITIPVCIETFLPDLIGGPFSGCSSLETIAYKGTKAQWGLISKNPGWDSGTGEYVVKCSDGTLTKEES